VVTDQQPKEQMLELHELEHDTATQSRVAIDPDTVEKYGELMRAGVKFEAIVVFYDGVRYWVADGWHRCGGAEWASKKSIACLIYQGSKEDAVLYSTGANARHGKAMSNADKRKCVETVLKIKGDWSDRAIAEHVGVSQTTVGTVRREVSNLDTSTAGPSLAGQFEKRIGKDGKSYPASQPMKENPVDRADRQVTDDLAALAAEDDSDPMLDMLADPYQEALRLLSRVASLIKEQAEDPDTGAYARDKITRITTDVQDLRACIRQIEPVKFCEPCHGQGCAKCRNTGFLTRAIVQTENQA
jgi:hypothetical protein